MIDKTKYMHLENVPGGYPLDVTYLNLAHVMAPSMDKFGIDAGSTILIFQEGSYSIFIERDKWFDAAEKIFTYVTESDKRILEWEKRLEKWNKTTIDTGIYYRDFNFSELSDEDLYKEFENILAFEKKNGIEDVEVVSSNYGTNLIYKKLEKVLEGMEFEPGKTAQVIFRSTGKFPLLEYEKEISRLAILCYEKGIDSLNLNILKENDSINRKAEEILSEYGWLDASLINEPKSIENVIRDVNDLSSVKDKLKGILLKKEKEEKVKRSEKEKLLNEVLSKSSPEQKRVIEFAVKSAELGRIVVDSVMQFIYHRRRIYPEMAKRLNITEIELKFMLAEEIKESFLDKKIDMSAIGERKKLAICILKDNNVEMVSGLEAEKLKNSLNSTLEDNSPLKGEIAFSKGKVKGIARLVKDASEMGKVNQGEILVSSRTYPDLLPAMKKSAAIIAELGGLLSHAAIVSRELGIPCIVGTKGATTKIKDGELIEVDTDTGKVRVLEKAK